MVVLSSLECADLSALWSARLVAPFESGNKSPHSKTTTPRVTSAEQRNERLSTRRAPPAFQSGSGRLQVWLSSDQARLQNRVLLVLPSFRLFCQSTKSALRLCRSE